MGLLSDTTVRHKLEWLVCVNPHAGMDLLLRNDLAFHQTTEEEVVIHHFCNDHSYRFRFEFDESVSFRPASLRGVLLAPLFDATVRVPHLPTPR